MYKKFEEVNTGHNTGELITAIVQQDYKYFSKNSLPMENATLGVGDLIDESGASSGFLIDSATIACIFFEDFCRSLSISDFISGYTSG